MQSVSQCPICDGKYFQPYLTCKDHTVSHETFELVKCQSCKLVITSPRPDAEQLGKYYLSENYISHTKESKRLFDKVYKISRLYTLKWKLNLIKPAQVKALENLSILDFGCGTGNFLNTCKNAGYSIKGVEPSSVARQIAVTQVGNNIHKDINEINTTFNVITLWHVLEHIPDLNEIIQKLGDRLDNNGTMFIAVPNRLSRDAEVYKQDWAAFDVPRHLWHFSGENMKQFLNKHNLTISRIIPMKLDAFYVSILSEKHRSGRNGIKQMIKGFVQGIKSNAAAKKTNQYSSLIYVAHKCK